MKKLGILILALVMALGTSVYAIGPGEYPHKRIALIGDSYAGFFVKLKPSIEYELFGFPTGGINKGSNEEIFSNLITNYNHDIIVFSTGVNDYFKGTPIEDFEAILSRLMKKAGTRGKFILVHTYMDFPSSNAVVNKSSVKDYDKVLRKLAEENPNVLYLDMSQYGTAKYYYGDGLHYNKAYYDILDSKIQDLAKAIEEMIYPNGVDNRVANRLMPGNVQTTS